MKSLFFDFVCLHLTYRSCKQSIPRRQILKCFWLMSYSKIKFSWFISVIKLLFWKCVIEPYLVTKSFLCEHSCIGFWDTNLILYLNISSVSSEARNSNGDRWWTCSTESRTIKYNYSTRYENIYLINVSLQIYSFVVLLVFTSTLYCCWNDFLLEPKIDGLWN